MKEWEKILRKGRALIGPTDRPIRLPDPLSEEYKERMKEVEKRVANPKHKSDKDFKDIR